MKVIISLLLLVCLGVQTHAVKAPKPGKVDPRVKTFTYSERDVYQIHAHYGFTSHIEFSPDEVIEHVSVGDSLAWHLVPKANHLFLKPIEDRADTNLTILTNLRSYNFELRAHSTKNVSDPSLTFAVSFRYPEVELKAAIAEEQARHEARLAARQAEQQIVSLSTSMDVPDWNLNYSRKGSEITAPVQVFDDGKFTYFRFANERDTPAIFLVDGDKKESLINYHVKGKYLVVQRIASQFILRHGDEATCIFNDSFDNLVEKSALPTADKSAD